MRLFIAILINEELQARSAQLQNRLKPQLASPAIRWVKPESLHFTLRFLGEQPEERLTAIRDSIQEAIQNQPGFEIRLGGLGVFPNFRRPAVLWLGVESGATEMRTLFQRLEQALTARGFQPEPREFHPHLTLARMKARVPDLEKVLRSLPADPLGSLKVEALSLMKSHLHPEGARYTELERFPFVSP